MKYPADFPLPTLAPGDIHLWSFPVSPYGKYGEEQEFLLSRREKEKAARFYKERDRIRCRVVYVLLRRILSLYTGLKPEEIEISLSENGKPYMEGENAPFFNFSHSGDRVLFAFAAGQEVGADLEIENECRDLDGLIENCCSEGEIACFQNLDLNERTRLFYRYWSSKEACLKGRGTGITVALKSVDCSSGNPVEGWTIVPLSHWSGYAAAVAVKRENPQILLITPPESL